MIGDRRSVPKALIVLGSTAFSPSPACPAFRAQHLAFRFHASSATHASPPQDNCQLVLSSMAALRQLCLFHEELSRSSGYADAQEIRIQVRAHPK